MTAQGVPGHIGAGSASVPGQASKLTSYNKDHQRSPSVSGWVVHIPGTRQAIGRMYEKGLGVAKDEQKAIEWYTKAAEQGDTFARKNLENLKNHMAREEVRPVCEKDCHDNTYQYDESCINACLQAHGVSLQ